MAAAVSSPKGEPMADLLKKKELTVSEVQRLTGLSRATIYNMLKRGEFQKGGSLTLVYGKRITTESVRKFMLATRREIPKN